METAKLDILPGAMDRDDIDLLSLGRLSELVQKTPMHLEAFAESIGIRPVLYLDSVSYFSSRQACRLLSRIREHDKR